MDCVVIYQCRMSLQQFEMHHLRKDERKQNTQKLIKMNGRLNYFEQIFYIYPGDNLQHIRLQFHLILDS